MSQQLKVKVNRTCITSTIKDTEHCVINALGIPHVTAQVKAELLSSLDINEAGCE